MHDTGTTRRMYDTATPFSHHAAQCCTIIARPLPRASERGKQPHMHYIYLMIYII